MISKDGSFVNVKYSEVNDLIRAEPNSYGSNIFQYNKPIIEENRYWYLATPYTKYEGGLDKAYEDASKMVAFLLDAGHFIFCPITHFHTPAKYTMKSTEEWYNLSIQFLKLARGLIVCKMDNWKNSIGIAKEIDEAGRLALPICYCDYMQLPILI